MRTLVERVGNQSLGDGRGPGTKLATNSRRCGKSGKGVNLGIVRRKATEIPCRCRPGRYQFAMAGF